MAMPELKNNSGRQNKTSAGILGRWQPRAAKRDRKHLGDRLPAPSVGRSLSLIILMLVQEASDLSPQCFGA
jgi:hypothetical protein